MHCCDCLSFQAISRSTLNCAPVNVNGTMNIFQGPCCQMLCKRRRPWLTQQRSLSIYLSGDWNRHSAISVYHFCFTSISELLFANCQRAPCERRQHFPFHLCVAGSSSTAICLWLFPIFPWWVQAQMQTETGKKWVQGGRRGWLNGTHTQTLPYKTGLSCPRTHRGRGHVPWGHFSLLAQRAER